MHRPNRCETAGGHSNGPLYRHVASSLRCRFERGEFKPGDQLPSERALMSEYAVSRVTIRRALRQLIDERMLAARHGSGYTVRLPLEQPMNRISGFSEQCRRRGIRADSRCLSCVETPCSAEEARELKLTPGETVLRVQRIRRGDGEPWMFEMLVLPDRAAINPPWPHGSLYAAFDAQGLRPVAVHQAYHPVMADEKLAAALCIGLGDPLMLVVRTGTCGSALPVEYAHCWYRPDRWIFAHAVGGSAV